MLYTILYVTLRLIIIYLQKRCYSLICVANNDIAFFRKNMNRENAAAPAHLRREI